MIPVIGEKTFDLIALMIGCYIVFRCVEALCITPARYGGQVQRVVVALAGIVTIAATVVIVILLLKSGAAPQTLPDLLP